MKIKGAKIIMECLREQGVDTIFGYPGGQIMPLYDALYDYRDEIKHILTCHEEGATHAADGYARSTGKTGVCFATSGPGATNTVTGIATAYMDSVPMVVITGQVPLSQIGKDSFQEVDITGITIPITKHNYFIRSLDTLADSIRQAFLIAKSGRPGPVLIDVPKDLMVQLYDYEPKPMEPARPFPAYNKESVAHIANLINNSKQPVIYAGGGIEISNSSEELTLLAEKGQIPVLSTLMSLGTISRKSPLSLGMVGMHGEKEANLALHNCDLLLALGARFSDRVTGDVSRFAKEAKIVHIDVDASEIGKNVSPAYDLVGDIKEILQELIPLVKEVKRDAWLSKVEGFKQKKNCDEKAFTPSNIINTIHDVVGDDVIVTTEVGQHQMWVAQMWPFVKPRLLLTSGGLGTMGYGLGAAIGAQIGNPDKQVVHFAGDGSFRMNCNELATVATQELPLITIVLKNNTLGMVRQWQKLFFDRRYSATTLADVVNYEKLAEAYGLNGYQVNNLDDLRKAVEAGVASKTATIIACDIGMDENVFPIVPPGEAINNQVVSEDHL